MARKFDKEIHARDDTSDTVKTKESFVFPTEPVRLIRIRRRKDLIPGKGFDLLAKIKGKIKVVSIIGPRASGKSTLMDAILDRPPP